MKVNNEDIKSETNDVVLKDNTDVISSIVLQPNQQISFIASFTPKSIQTYEGMLQLTVTDNQFEDTLIHFIGEGYMEDVTIDNLHNINNAEFEEEIIADEDVSGKISFIFLLILKYQFNQFVLIAIKGDSINFGDIYINENKKLLFTMTNRNKTICYRFEWPENNWLSFSPRVGHLHCNCAKDIAVTFKSSEPKYMKKELINCLLTKITFEHPINEIKDWDDRMTVIKWVNEIVLNNNITNDINRPSSATTSSIIGTHTSKSHTIKKKITETEIEPQYSKYDDSIQSLQLYISANCDYSRYKCSSHVVRFKDTLMFQTRIFE